MKSRRGQLYRIFAIGIKNDDITVYEADVASSRLLVIRTMSKKHITTTMDTPLHAFSEETIHRQLKI